MIKPGEYIQILKFFSTPNRDFLLNYSLKEKLDWFETVQRLDEIRHTNQDFQKECELYSIYKNLDLKKLNLYREELLSICIQFNITVYFTSFESLEFRKGFVSSFKYKGTDITDLLMFYTKRKKSAVSE